MSNILSFNDIEHITSRLQSHIICTYLTQTTMIHPEEHFYSE